MRPCWTLVSAAQAERIKAIDASPKNKVFTFILPVGMNQRNIYATGMRLINA